MKRNTIIKGFGLFFLAFAVIITGLTTVYAKEKTEILIGTNLPMTGMLGNTGLEQRWAFEQAAADFNKKGGIYIEVVGKKLPIKLVVADDESDPGKAAAAVEKLIKVHKVDLMLSTHSTPLVIPSCVTAEKYKRYYHSTACLIPVWGEQKFKWSTMFFINMHTFADSVYKVMDVVPGGVKGPAMLMEDTLDGRGLGGVLRGGAEAAGYKLVVDEPWAVGAKDYSSQILKLKAKKVDSLILFGSPADTITFLRQMKEVNFNVKYFHGFKGTWASEFWNALGEDAQHIMCDGFWSETYSYPGAKELGKRYTRDFNKRSISIGAFYATAQVLFMAIEQSKSLDDATVRDTVLNREFKGTVMGDVKYGPDGSFGFQVTNNQWVDGTQKLVYPFVEGASKVQVIPPWNKR